MKSNEKSLALTLMKNPDQDSDNVIANIHKIMDAAIGARPNDVGTPISILAIESNGQPQWLEPGLCQDILRPSLPNKPGEKIK